MLLLHVSDTHLGASKPLSYSKQREEDFYEVFDEVIEIAIREHVDGVLHCGDLFDDPEPSPRTYYNAVKSLKKLSSAGIPFLVIAGQHDQPKRAGMSPLRVLEEVGVVKVLALGKPNTGVVNLRSGELGISAIPYTPPGSVPEVLRELRKPATRKSILMAHLLLKELNLPTSHVSLMELGVNNFSYVALGDYHLRWSTNYSGVPVVYPGSTEALDVLESSDERYVAVVDLSGESTSVSWVKLSRFRRMLVIDNVSSLADLQRAVSKYRLEELKKQPILYVRLSSKGGYTSSSERVRIEQLLRDLVRQGRIINYKLILPGVEEAEGEGGDVVEEAPPPTLDYVVYEVVKDPELSELLLKIIRGGEGVESVRKVIDDILTNERLMEKLRKAVSKR